jgi:hypothetical protein
MQENRGPGERLDRHPAAGTWERTSHRFHRDRSRRPDSAAPVPLGCGQGFRAARLQTNFAVFTSHVSAQLGRRAVPRVLVNRKIRQAMTAPPAIMGMALGLLRDAGAEPLAREGKQTGHRYLRKKTEALMNLQRGYRRSRVRRWNWQNI